jgi:hypothetical protein
VVASSEYHVNIIVSQKSTGDANVKKAIGSWTELKSALGLVKGAFSQVYQVASKVYAFMGEGAEVDRAQSAITNLAKSYGQSGDEIIKAIQGASDFTIDRMTAMQVANKAMLMGVAKSPEQFSELARTATILGRAMGLDATTAIDRFTIAAGRKSTKVADDLGLLVDATAANEKYAESLNKTVDQLTASEQSQAFLNAMMDAARPKVAALGSSTIDTKGKMEQAEAAVKDTRAGVSELAIAYLESTGFLDNWNVTLGASRDITNWLTKALTNNKEVVEETGRAIQGYNGYVSNGVSTMADFAGGTVRLTAASKLYLAELAEHETLGDDFINTTRNIGFAIEKAAIDKLAEATRKTNEYNDAIKRFSLDAGMRWKSYYDDVDEKAADFETRREQLATRHQETLDELAKRGQSRAIAVDAVAEQAKLDLLQSRLNIALQSQAEFTDKTRESTRMRKDLEIKGLQTQVAEQAKLLDDYHAGRLRTAGENVNALIGEEERRHKAAVEGLEEEIAKTQELQKQQLGTLMLQTFETWAEIKDIPAEKMLEMRTAIAKEYGLISDEEALLVGLSVKTWENWATDFGTSADAVVTDLAAQIEMVRNLQLAIEDLPDSKVIDFIVNIRREQVYTPEPQLGGPGGLDRPNVTNNNTFNQTVHTQATTHSVANDFRTAQALVE